MAAILKILKTKSTTLSDDLFLCQVLMISDNRKNHYCWIKDLNRLLGYQHSNTRRCHYCPYCLHGFIKERLIEGSYTILSNT